MSTKWTYRVARTLGRDWATISDRLNELGQDGWELVAMEPDYDGGDADYVAVFKRPVEGARS